MKFMWNGTLQKVEGNPGPVGPQGPQGKIPVLTESKYAALEDKSGVCSCGYDG